MPYIRRRKFLINKPLQFRLLWQSLLYVLLFVVVTGVSLFLPAMIELRNMEEPSAKTVQAAKQVLYLHDYFWPAALFVVITIFLLSIRSSNKIAGPLFRFNRTFEAIKEGKLPPPILIRKDDYLLQEAEVINQMLESLRAKVRAIQEAQNVLNETISECAQAAKHASSTEIDERFKDLVEIAHQHDERIRTFRIIS
jgi:methyl-accepting chemotaxis protein